VAEALDDDLVVDDLVVAVHGRLEGAHHPGERLDRHLDPRAEAAGRGEQHLVDGHRRQRTDAAGPIPPGPPGTHRERPPARRRLSPLCPPPVSSPSRPGRRPRAPGWRSATRCWPSTARCPATCSSGGPWSTTRTWSSSCAEAASSARSPWP